ncbi:YibL family ribosome-associated protein [Enterovibrio sp. ZSDZ35]|uniref:YibL family ribosome-associated protein n=1 Tax=Enterovibrio qingdaonensis TaxID=2899818 RepID=A0ABT5QIH0_9GAMM|nr:YibL family ribosome-associated protein [Enterovibrio sp. ZSDZ35]MDD1780782.1 YibL family ribosome-associated protein [Enterovibrio sp. ZSDZ35]
MSMKQELQQQKNRLNKSQIKLDAAKSRGDDAMVTKFTNDIEDINKKISQLTHKQSFELNKERKTLLDMPFSREITKQEQADMGKLKKSVKGLVVVHPLTKIGKELKLDVVTGFAPKAF